MKFYLVLFPFFSLNLFCQTPSNLTAICVDNFDPVDYTYFADIEDTFTPFIGTWEYVNNNEIVTFRITKLTQHYFPNQKFFRDILIGDYSYSIDDGSTYLINTIHIPISTSAYDHPMSGLCVEDNSVKFIFRDVLLDKGFAYATFKFEAGSTTQLQVQIRNPDQTPFRFNDEEPYNLNFTMPTDMTVTKQ